MPDDVGILAAHHGKQGIRIDRDGGADASAADVDLCLLYTSPSPRDLG